MLPRVLSAMRLPPGVSTYVPSDELWSSQPATRKRPQLTRLEAKRSWNSTSSSFMRRFFPVVVVTCSAIVPHCIACTMLPSAVFTAIAGHFRRVRN